MANSRYQIAWGLALCFYFLEYASRSAAGGDDRASRNRIWHHAIGVSAILELLLHLLNHQPYRRCCAGPSRREESCARRDFILAIGCLLFAIPTAGAGYAGRLLQARVRPLPSLVRCIWPRTVSPLAG